MMDLKDVKAIQQYQPDLIFLDIQMPKINGFEMLELIEQPPAVIFTTAFDEYAIKAFEAHAIDYLLKPFNQERFDKAIAKWMEQKQYCYRKLRLRSCWKPRRIAFAKSTDRSKEWQQDQDHSCARYILPGSRR